MRMRDYWQASRDRALAENADKVEKSGNLMILREGSAERPAVRIWRGEQGRPYANFLFRSAESRETYIESEKKSDKASSEIRQKWKAERRSKEVQALVTTQVGDILYDSWGYDQTNIDWFQVVRKTASRFVVKPIACTYKDDGFMTGEEMPIKDRFTGSEEIVTAKRYYAWDGRPKRSSSYA